MEITRHWRLRSQRYRLEGAICLACGQLIFPPRPICPYCSAQPVWFKSRELTVFSKSIDITGLEPYMSYQIINRGTLQFRELDDKSMVRVER